MNDPDSFRKTFRNGIFEARFAVVVWFLALCWTVGYCYLNGYTTHEPDSTLVEWGLAEPRSEDNLRTVWGVPDWVFYGVFVPWFVCFLITVGYGIFVMGDDDLGQDPASGMEPTDGR